MIRFCVCVINYAIRFSTMFMKPSWKKLNTSPELSERFNQAYIYIANSNTKYCTFQEIFIILLIAFICGNYIILMVDFTIFFSM